MNDISFSRVGTRFLTCFPFRPTLRTLSPPPSPAAACLLAFLSNKRILQLRSSFSGQEEERRGEGNGCCSATKAVIARTFVLLSEGCRRRRDAGASPHLVSPRRSHKSGPTVFPGGSNAYRVFRVSRSRMGREESGGSERRGAEGGGGRKKDAEKRWREEERGEKKLLARQRCASTRTRLIVPKERIFTERFRAVAKEIRR